MAYTGLQAFVQKLESEGELLRIKSFVNPHLEIAEITDRISKSDNNKALLFENTGTDFPVLINALGSEKRIALALGVHNLESIQNEIESVFQTLIKPRTTFLEKLSVLPTLSKFSGWLPRVVHKRGQCQEVINTSADITKFPVLTCWPKDGGAFLTLPLIHTLDPITNMRNLGMYRMQVFSPTCTGMHWHKHKVSAKHFESYKKLGKKMPVAVALGGDPVYTYAATAPLPENVDEYILAGFLRKKKVQLVPCITQKEIAVPEDADIIIEGYVDPNKALLWEGPFGDHTGFYSLPDWYPAFHITAITHRKNAIYPATIVGIPPQEDAWIGKATERIFIHPIKMTMSPELIDMNMPIEGVFHNLVLVQIQKEYAGHALKVMNTMWGAGQMMFNKILVITEQAISSHHYEQVAQIGLRHFDPETDIHIGQGPMDVLDHSCNKLGFGGKICFDLTRKFPEEQNNESTHIPYNKEAIERLIPSFPEDIFAINTDLLAKEIPLLWITVKKHKAEQIPKLHTAIGKSRLAKGIKIIIYLNDFVPAHKLSALLWIACNNIDPKRDTLLYKTDNPKIHCSCLGLDATIKTKILDGFQRDWPNPIISDDATIKAVDEKWETLNIGDFIPSPSLTYKPLVIGKEAHIEDFS